MGAGEIFAGIVKWLNASGATLWDGVAAITAIIAVYRLPEIIKAASTFVKEYRKTSADITAKQKLLALELERKRAKSVRRKSKEIGQ